jgi:DNA/RNA-binding domain of Phe-tRNA-synthetase-like protein
MKFSVSKEVFDIFPELNIAVIVLRDIDNHTEEKGITKLLRQEEEHCRKYFKELKVSEHPNITSWRKAYTAFGAGSHYRCSVEALTKRVVKGGEIPSINKLVDIYNLISIKHCLPVGGEDLKKIKGDVELVRASGDESFKALGSEEEDPPQKGEVVYVDQNNDVLCRRFNWRESDKTKLTKKTTDAVLYIEGLPPTKDIEVKEAAHDFHRFAKKYCGGRIELYLINQNFPEVIFKN